MLDRNIFLQSSSVALQKVLENSFVLGMNYAQAKVYFVRCQDGFSRHQAFCYDKSIYETLERGKNVLVLEELRLQKKKFIGSEMKTWSRTLLSTFC